MTSTRTDIHRPVEMDPANYDFVTTFDAGSDEPLDRFDAEAIEAATTNPLVRMWRCTHCGAHIRYHAILKYIPTGEYIFCGETCLDNRFSLVSKGQFDALRKAAALDRKAAETREAAIRNIESFDLDEATKLFLLDRKGTEGHHIALDIRRKLYRYGSISQRQADFVAKLVAEANAPKPVRPTEVLVDVPEGRLTIVGEVLTTKWVENDFGGTLKMLVKVTTPAGIYKVWGTVPGSISVDRGDHVSFSAQVTQKETGFGFYSRPTKALVTQVAQVAA
jgi:hypothetical protein